MTQYVKLDDDIQHYITSYLASAFVIRKDGCYIRGIGDNGRTVGPIPPPDLKGFEAVGLVQRYGRWMWKMVEMA